jgi:glycosyltransferase involved in cell wall biosynthesis
MSAVPSPTATPGGRPLVSVIVPSYNQGRFLAECLDSILAQDYRPLEIVVVDGASRDTTLEVLRSRGHVPELRWISEPDDGPADAVNKGLAAARGTIAGILSADDLYLPGAVSSAVQAFEGDGELGLVYGDSRSIAVDGTPKGERRRPPHDNALCIALCVFIPQNSAFFRLALARELGGWRKQFFTSDWDLWLRMMFRTRVRKLDAVLSCWRMYPEQRTDQRRKVFESFNRMIDDAPEIRGSRLKRAALAGKQLIHLSYGPNRSPAARLWHVLAATALFPAVWPYVPTKATLWPRLPDLRRWLRRRFA